MKATHFSFLFTISLMLIVFNGYAQLNNFTVIQRNGKNIIGWNNANPEIRQLIIQKSTDSLTGFKSIVTMPDPTAAINGFLDKNSDSTIYFYRLFAMMPGGRYFFTESKKAINQIISETIAIKDNKSITVTTKNSEAPVKSEIPINQAIKTPVNNPVALTKEKTKTNPSKTENNPPKIDSIEKSTSQSTIAKPKEAPKIIDSIASTVPQRIRVIERVKPLDTKTVKIGGIKKIETLNVFDSSILNLYEPSGFIYTNADGNLIIVLPDPQKKHFNMKVTETDGSTVFIMKNIKESELLLDRSNFMHSGWFNYELTENGKLRERNKFYIPPIIK